MPVEVAALALVVHQTVPVAEMDLAGDSKHRGAVPGLVSGDWRSAHHPRGSRAHSRQGSGSGPEHPRPGIPSAAPHICYTTHSAFRTPDRCTRTSVERKVLSPQHDVALLVVIEGTNQTGRT